MKDSRKTFETILSNEMLHNIEKKHQGLACLSFYDIESIAGALNEKKIDRTYRVIANEAETSLFADRVKHCYKIELDSAKPPYIEWCSWCWDRVADIAKFHFVLTLNRIDKKGDSCKLSIVIDYKRETEFLLYCRLAISPMIMRLLKKMEDPSCLPYGI